MDRLKKIFYWVAALPLVAGCLHVYIDITYYVVEGLSKHAIVRYAEMPIFLAAVALGIYLLAKGSPKKFILPLTLFYAYMLLHLCLWAWRLHALAKQYPEIFIL